MHWWAVTNMSQQHALEVMQTSYIICGINKSVVDGLVVTVVLL